jgi:hypothetical protein
MLPAVTPKNTLRLAERLERLGALPVRLGDDADAEALRLEHAADHRHAEAWMIDIGIPGDDHHVASCPSRAHPSLARGRQELRRAEAGCQYLR